MDVPLPGGNGDVVKVHLHELVAAVLTVIIWTTIAILAVAQKESSSVLENGGFAALAYVFGARASTTIERLPPGR